MDQVAKLDKVLENWFKQAPKLSKQTKDWLVGAWPTIALVLGVVQLIAAYSLWRLMSWTNNVLKLNDSFRGFYVNSGYGLSFTDRLSIYVSIFVTVLTAAVFLKAYPELKKKSPTGWYLLFLATGLSAVYSLLELFITGRGVGSFIFGMIGTGIGLYLLYQIKDSYIKKASTPKK